MTLRVFFVLTWFICLSFSFKPPISHRFRPAVPVGFDNLIDRCDERWFTQDIDHFGWKTPVQNKTTFLQRYYVCSEYWDGDGPIFFYTGNEADVTLYLNATGLMWENAPQFHALLIFAEHRYFGKSLPYEDQISSEVMNYLSAEQALLDFATLIYNLRFNLPARDNAIIAFGGSYGGMLASWLRIKYPSAIDGAIAASAPILAFLGLDPPFNPNSYANIETADASPACRQGIRKSWNIISQWATTDAGRQNLRRVFRICKPLPSVNDAMQLFGWVSSAISFLAMGNYPYATSYITNGGCALPPWPMNTGCAFFDSASSDEQILSALRSFSGIFYNCTGRVTCFDLSASVNNDTARDGAYWDYLSCTGIQIPFSQNGITDMFWPSPYSLNASIAQCKADWNVVVRPLSPVINYGGRRLAGTSNIVFTNGVLDPWHGGGVLTSVSDSVVAVLIENAAHHLDLMFSNPRDPPSVIKARSTQLDHIRKWITEKKFQIRPEY